MPELRNLHRIKMQDLEKLLCEVETYPSLYDKSSPTYKEMIPKKYAWARIGDRANID